METTLNDDVYQEDPTTSSFENHVAELTGHSAGLFVLSGTVANQLSIRTLLSQPPHAVLCDARAHIIHWEAGGIASQCGAMVQSLPPSNGEYLTFEDIQRKVVLSEDVHKCPTRVITLEYTISGLISRLSETMRISKRPRTNGLKLHLDDARLGEAVAAGAGSLREYAQCFDSVALDFSKGLGAPMGAIVVGDSEFIARVRRIRKSMGGGMRQAGVLSAAARAALDETSGPMLAGSDVGGKLDALHSLARRVADMWTRRGGKLRRRVQTNIVWLDLNSAGVVEEIFQDIGQRHGVKVDGCRIVLHYQIGKEGIRRL